jgi:hypothetical protein
MMDSVRTSETPVYIYETTRCCIPEGCHLHSGCENLSSYVVYCKYRSARDNDNVQRNTSMFINATNNKKAVPSGLAVRSVGLDLLETETVDSNPA